MSLIQALRAGVKTLNAVTKSGGLQALVEFRHFVYVDEYGNKTYLPAIGQPAAQLQAIVDWKQRQVRTTTGILSVSRASVTFLDVAALAAATNNEGVADEDIIVLPDGTTGPILDMSGFIDGGTGQPLATEVFLG